MTSLSCQGSETSAQCFINVAAKGLVMLEQGL